MVKILLYIKHHLPFLWQVVDWLNSFLFRLLHGKKFQRVAGSVISGHQLPGFEFRQITAKDLPALAKLLADQPKERVAFFKPHNFDIKSLEKTFNNPSFLMMSVFDGPRMVGYFFLRCFWNKKCFVGRLIDKLYEGKGIGRVMNQIMYNIGWDSGFKVLSTISKNNQLVIKSHANNQAMKILKELVNDYLLVEFVKEKV
jgi:hypothetical protein